MTARFQHPHVDRALKLLFDAAGRGRRLDQGGNAAIPPMGAGGRASPPIREADRD